MNIPCFITTIRIICTFCLIFTIPFSNMFYMSYVIAGISDVLDGYVARKTNQTSEFGAKLDSVADIFFYVVMVIKIFPILWSKLPIGIWYAVAVAVIVRLTSYAVAAIKYKCFSSMHTYMNKLTGFLIFVVPLVVELHIFIQFCIGVCVVAFLSSLEELIIHIKSKEYNSNVKTILKAA